jgi:hypothetical protein
MHSHSNIFHKVVTPYDPAAFSFFLDKYNLRDAYPDLVSFIAHGFPIGVMPALEATNILNNHPSIFLHPDLVDDYLSEEVSSGRVDGPFSRTQVSAILRGHFQSSPLVIVSQPQAPGEPDKVCICRHCYDPQPYARFASICHSIRVCVSSILVLFEPATFVYLFS